MAKDRSTVLSCEDELIATVFFEGMECLAAIKVVTDLLNSSI